MDTKYVVRTVSFGTFRSSASGYRDRVLEAWIADEHRIIDTPIGS